MDFQEAVLVAMDPHSQDRAGRADFGHDGGGDRPGVDRLRLATGAEVLVAQDSQSFFQQ